ncbi:MAG TPA: hypothetical protein DEE98_05985 [Elusimicrobia bacterium]|nr:hypothetical protein [Elusimicrobiota bacterium]
MKPALYVRICSEVNMKLLVKAVVVAGFLAFALNPAGFAAAELTVEDMLFLDMDTDIVTKTKLKISESPAIVTVVTAQDIKEMGARQLNDVFSTLPGMYFSIPCSDIYAIAPTIYLRGIHSNQIAHPMVKLLINGTPITDALQDGWGALNIYGSAILPLIERIEIIRGPGSVTYGGSAISGVINIVTKKGAGNEAGLSAGSTNLQRGYAKITGEHGNIKINAMASTGNSYLTDSVVGSRALGTLLQSEKQRNYDFISRDYLLDLSLNGFLWQNIFLDEIGNAPFTNAYMLADNKYPNTIIKKSFISSVSKSFSTVIGALTSKIFYRKVIYGFDTKITAPNIPSPLWTEGMAGIAEHTSDAFSGQTELLYNGIENQEILAGCEILYEDMPDALTTWNLSDPNVFTQAVYMGAKLRKQYSLYTQDTLYSNNRKLSLNLGLRYDNYSDIVNGSAYSPRVAVVYKLLEDYVLKAMYGTAFRPPSFMETSVTNHPTIKNDPNIGSEVVKSFELALDCSPMSKTNLRINYYNNVVNDLIARVQSDEPSKSWNTNVGNQKSWGLESELKFMIDKRSYIFANAGYLGDSSDTDTGIKTPFVPEILFNSGVNYAFTDNLSAMLRGFYRSELKQGSGDIRGNIAPFWLYTTTVNYNIYSHNVYVSVYNLLDQAWYDVSLSSNMLIDHIPGYGRRFDVGYRYYF